MVDKRLLDALNEQPSVIKGSDTLKPIQINPITLNLQTDEDTATQDFETYQNALNRNFDDSKFVPTTRGALQKTKEQKAFAEKHPVANTVGETIKNTLVNRPIELATGFVDTVLHPVETVVNPLAGYAAQHYSDLQTGKEQPLQALGRIARDTADTMIVKPLTDQTIKEMQNQPLSETLRKYGEAVKAGHLADAVLIARAVPGVAKAMDAGLIKAGGKVLNTATGGKFGEFQKVNKAKQMIREQTVLDKIEAINKAENIKGDIQDFYKKYNITKDDLEGVFKKAEGNKELNLDNLTERERLVLDNLEPILNDIDDLHQMMPAAVAQNELEIVQRGVRRLEQDGVNTTYQTVRNKYRDYGFFDEGQYVDRNTGEIVRPRRTAVEALSEENQKPMTILKNARFELTPEGQANIAEMALDFSSPEAAERALAAQEFLTDYRDAAAGKLRRISHGEAPVNKEGVKVDQKSRYIDDVHPFFSERTYGNATFKDIATEWMDPDTMLRSVVTNILKTKTLEQWFNEGKPIMSKGALPEDMVYIRKDALAKGSIDNAIKNPIKELGPKANPEEYAAIDKYTLKAFRELFYPDKDGVFKVNPFFRDVTQLFKEGLIGSGLYLGGNLTAGIHSLLTNSNVNVVGDIANAVKTRGNLIRELGLQRRLDKYGTHARMATKPDTVKGQVLRKISKFNNISGTWVNRALDTSIQNSIAEANAHAILRKQGIPFENRNLNWMKQNMTKEQIYKTIQDIQDASMIYGDETLLPREFLRFAELGNPFFRWQDQAAKSSMWLMKNNPRAYGYLQGAVLGGYAWDQNLARADGMNIDNPQSGKLYRYDRNGNAKVTETEMIPILTTLKFFENPSEYFMKADKNASIGAILGAFDEKDKYGRLKRRSSDVVPITGNKIYSDYQHNVRYNEKGERVGVGWDEAFNSLAKTTVPIQMYNKTIAPVAGSIINKVNPEYQTYTPYNDQLFTDSNGNPMKPYGVHEVANRLLTNYEHNPIAGEDYTITEKELERLERLEDRSKRKAEKARQDALRRKGGNQ